MVRVKVETCSTRNKTSPNAVKRNLRDRFCPSKSLKKTPSDSSQKHGIAVLSVSYPKYNWWSTTKRQKNNFKAGTDLREIGFKMNGIKPNPFSVAMQMRPHGVAHYFDIF